RVVYFFGKDDETTFNTPSGLYDRFDVTNTNSGGPAVSAGDMSHFVDTDTGTKNATIASDSNNGARVSGTIAIKKATEPESEPESDTTAPTLTVVTTVTSPTR